MLTTITAYVPAVAVVGIVKVVEKCPRVSEYGVSSARMLLCPLGAIWTVSCWAGNQFSPVTVIVPPGCTVEGKAVTVTDGAVVGIGVGVVAGVGVGEPPT